MAVSRAVGVGRWSAVSELRFAWAGGVLLALIVAACLAGLPWAAGSESLSAERAGAARRFEAVRLEAALLPPFWALHADDERARLDSIVASGIAPPRPLLGTDRLGRDLLARCLVGGCISIGIGLAAAMVSVVIGTIYGTLAGHLGGRWDGALMRFVDILYGLPSVLVVVLLSVASEGLLERADEAAGAGRASASAALASMLRDHRGVVNVVTLLLAIGAVSWLTMARVIRGQVLSLKAQPFMEACRAIGVPMRVQFTRHLLPNLAGPIIVYATLAVPTAILSESFLSFLGIGVREPLPSWGNLAAEGLGELNLVRVRWWLLLWPCALIATTLLAMNFVGESLREWLDPRRAPDPRRAG